MDIDTVVGRLYGNLLLRNADQMGFAHYYDLLSNGAKVQDVVGDFLTCTEFLEKFIFNDTPNEVARKLIVCLLDEQVATPQFIRECAELYIASGYPALVKTLTNDPRYGDFHGELEVPVYG